MECPVCQVDDRDTNVGRRGDMYHVRCPRCGKFAITGTAIEDFRGRFPAGMRCWLRNRSETGEPETLGTGNIPTILETLPTYRPAEKQLLLLRAIERMTKFPGDRVIFVPSTDYPLAWASSEAEVKYLTNALLDRHLLSVAGGAGGPRAEGFVDELVISSAGWDFLDTHKFDPAVSNQAFVAMSFADDLKPAWTDGIRVGIDKAGWRPYRVDDVPHTDRIDTRIMSEIKSSRFVVADVTGQRPGVYFEAGYAIGLGLPVIWSVREDELAHVHFDTRQYNHIVWTDPQHLAQQLEHFVKAVIGHAPRRG